MLTVENVVKSYGEKILFNEVSCTIKENDRIGLIGVNGTGKSTFLKVIAGIETPESGLVKHAKDYHIEYLSQDPVLDPELTVIEQIYFGDSVIMKTMREYERTLLELMENPTSQTAQKRMLTTQQKMDENKAWEANTTAKTVLTKLGITDFNKQVTDLSGGQKKRVAIAKALIQPADLLILDEPTNHLDHATIEWLEKFLASYRGAMLLVTHDRYFLNRVTNHMYELNKGNLYKYTGNYESFLEKKAEREELEESSQQKHENILRREIAWLRRGAKARSTKQKARIDRVEDMKEKSFDTNKNQVAFQAGSKRLGKKVLELTGIEKYFGDKQLFTSFDYLVVPGERLGIVGPNGSGKTTLLNIMANRLNPDTGTIDVGETVKIGYYTQENEEINEDLRVIDYIKEVAEVIHTKDGEVITAEQMLERFLFPRSEQWNYIRKLSGGEKRRLYLLKILMLEPNVLFLDEPTNDLDTETLSILEDYLANFPGVVITVSHDRYFLDRVVDQLLVLSETPEVTRFYGNYSEYLEKQETEKVSTPMKEKPSSSGKKAKKKLSYNDQNEWNQIEDQITELETRIESLKEAIAGAGSDLEKVQDLYKQQEEVENQLEQKMERWEELSILVEEMEAGK
ncbi:ABC-F family ATP-binding cassette domain-containing protein [Virgibacillus necropolis]|uniref:Multidrug ABC transporter ATP-binding protein n=1 Tax=Virgibacillus necropolis TaxID=163877 RepID=A0A221MGY4_9BACI|nr:ABC-F family ATP-binding cassette domain-containing protein [Virgibacillus necropolis]ASN06928.1 multidrug ABC transporter ATP-binding protein [Virgibacillus necropolis]